MRRIRVDFPAPFGPMRPMRSPRMIRIERSSISGRAAKRLLTLSNSATKQLSKRRAGLFLVGFHGIEADSLVAVAQQDLDPNQPPTALRRHVSDFLSGQGRDHVVGVGFISKTGLQPAHAGHVTSGGSAYVFPKKESPFWHADFAGLFNE